MNEQELEILLVEDNPGDARLAAEVFKDARVSHRLRHVPDGEQALAYLRRQGQYAGARRPNLILLDLNLPRKDGRQVLAEIKADEHLRWIPVVVLTTSQDAKDIWQAYDLRANCYVPKPIDLAHFQYVMRLIEEFWLRIVKLPFE